MGTDYKSPKCVVIQLGISSSILDNTSLFLTSDWDETYGNEYEF